MLNNLLEFALSTHDIFAAVTSKLDIVQRYAFYLRCQNEYSLMSDKYIQWYDTVSPDSLMISAHGECMFFPERPTKREDRYAYLTIVFVYMCRSRLSMIAPRIKADKVIHDEDLCLISRAYTGGYISDIMSMKETEIYEVVKSRLEWAAKCTIDNSTNSDAYEVLYLARYWFNAHINRANKKRYESLGEYAECKYRNTCRAVIDACYEAIVRAAIVHKLPFYMYEDLLEHLCYYDRVYSVCGQEESYLFYTLRSLYKHECTDDEGYTSTKLEFDTGTALRIAMKIYDNTPYHSPTTVIAVSRLPEHIGITFCEMLGREEVESKFKFMLHCSNEWNWQPPRLKSANPCDLSDNARSSWEANLLWNMRYSYPIW